MSSGREGVDAWGLRFPEAVAYLIVPSDVRNCKNSEFFINCKNIQKVYGRRTGGGIAECPSPLYTPLGTSQVYAINDVTLKGEGGVHINVTIRDEGGGGGLSVA